MPVSSVSCILHKVLAESVGHSADCVSAHVESDIALPEQETLPPKTPLASISATRFADTAPSWKPANVNLDVPHLYQKNLDLPCRKAALKMVSKFLKAQGFSSRQISNLLPTDIFNTKLITTTVWPRPIARPLPEDLQHVTSSIDQHLNAGLPAIVYVQHDHKKGGIHAVVVTGREFDEQGNVKYRFLDPGSSSAEPRFFSFNGTTYIKPRDQLHSTSVPHSQYILSGVFPYLPQNGTQVAVQK